MKFAVPERLVLLNLLPAEGNIVTLRVVQQLRMELSFSEEELSAAEVVEEGGQVRWNRATAMGIVKDVTIGDAARGLIVDTLKGLNDKGELTAGHISLYEKFVEEKT